MRGLRLFLAAHVWAKTGVVLRVPTPGQPIKPVALLEDSDPVHTSKLPAAAPAARAQ